MSCIVYQKNKTNGNIYAYKSESYRDPVTKKPKSKRTYIGRVDPDTNMIIPKAEEGKRNRSPKDESFAMMPETALEEINRLKKLITDLQLQVDELTRKENANSALIVKMKQLLDKYE